MSSVRGVFAGMPHRDHQTRWVVAGGCVLAFMCAAVNAGFLVHFGTSVSHLTGDVSHTAIDLFTTEARTPLGPLAFFGAAVAFILGAAVSGFYIHHPRLEFSRPYGRAITAIGCCLFVAWLAFDTAPMASIAFAAFACGLQNAMATHYRGIILRTSHVTGLLTDLGSHIGMKLAGHHIAAPKIVVPALLVLSFFLGALFGGLMVLRWHAPFLPVFAAAYVTGGLGWTAVRMRQTRQKARDTAATADVDVASAPVTSGDR